MVRYDVTLRPDFAARSFTGSTRIEVRGLRVGVRELTFSDNALILDSVTVDGRPAKATRSDGRLTIALPTALHAGRTAVVAVAHSGTPKRGVSFGARSAHTSYFACDWMICAQDRPGDKAAFSLTLTVPDGLTSVATGRLQSRTAAATGEEVHVWREERPYSAYLYGFAVGPYATATDRATT